jgi:hypothetical protein
MRSGVPVMQLQKLWDLCDVNKDGKLDLEEFILIMHFLVLLRNKQISNIPENLPQHLRIITRTSTPNPTEKADNSRLYPAASLSRTPSKKYEPNPQTIQPMAIADKTVQLELELIDEDIEKTEQKIKALNAKLSTTFNDSSAIDGLVNRLLTVQDNQNELLQEVVDHINVIDIYHQYYAN